MWNAQWCTPPLTLIVLSWAAAVLSLKAQYLWHLVQQDTHPHKLLNTINQDISRRIKPTIYKNSSTSHKLWEASGPGYKIQTVQSHQYVPGSDLYFSLVFFIVFFPSIKPTAPNFRINPGSIALTPSSSCRILSKNCILQEHALVI